MNVLYRIIDFTLDREGGFSDHPLDEGGATNFGITQKTLSSVLGRPAEKEDVKNLNRATARDIYFKFYAAPCRINLIQHKPKVALIVFDQAVNRGPIPSVTALQRVLNTLTGAELPLDGIIGLKTISALNAADEDTVADALQDAAREAYRNIVIRNPPQNVFLKGWLARVDHYATFEA